MDPFLATVSDLLSLYGPGLLFLMAVAETCFITGLVVPSGVATSIGTVLALESGTSVGIVLLAAGSGGAVGDSIGFWVGRLFGERLEQGDGRLARTYRRNAEAAHRYFGLHPFHAVTLARLVSFVRTVMPMAAGMSPVRYRTFLPFELIGVTLWAIMYAGIGLLARESWAMVASLVGVGWVLVFALIGVALWIRARRRRLAGSGTRAC